MSLCRTCGNKIKISSRYIKPKPAVTYASAIQQLFEVNILEDKDLVHPKGICDVCWKKFDRYNKSITELFADTLLIDYVPHTDTDCYACTIRTTIKKGFPLLLLILIQKNPFG